MALFIVLLTLTRRRIDVNFIAPRLRVTPPPPPRRFHSNSRFKAEKLCVVGIKGFSSVQAPGAQEGALTFAPRL